MSIKQKSSEAELTELKFPGDKSLSHRAAIFAGLAKGTSQISNFLTAGDTLNTLKAMQACGVTVQGDVSSGTFSVTSSGMQSFRGENLTIDVGNSGTGARLLMGLFSGLEGVNATITGDESLQKRPMGRVTTPLLSAGARFESTGTLPVKVEGTKLLPILHKESLGSAQVKSALILAAIASGVSVRMEEPIPSRDHSENMLRYAGVELNKEALGDGFLIEMEPPYEIKPRDYQIWGDVSSASFFVVLALLMKEGSLRICDVLLSPFRTRYLKVLREMGGNIEIIEKESRCGEPGGDIIVKPSKLTGIQIDPSDIPSLIDELPILTIAGLFAEGEFGYRNAKELRYKESDRISAMVENLKNLGVIAQEFEDGLSLQGNPQCALSGEVKAFHDHRIVMSFEVAGALSRMRGGQYPIIVGKDNWVSTSFPEFYDKFNQVAGEWAND